MRFQQNGNQTRMVLTQTGNIVVASSNDLTANANTPFHVNGNAFKTQGGGQWTTSCDQRLKDDIHDLDYGLEKVLQVRPVRFSYNGKGGTRAGDENIGIIGQEIEKIFPEMIHRAPAQSEDALDTDDMLLFDGSGIQFVLINAIKELAAKIEKLEAQLVEANAEK